MCDCDGDRPKYYESTMVRGRADYGCAECLRVIPKGESHQFVNGLWLDEWLTFRTCNDCLRVIQDTKTECYCLGQLLDCIPERDFPELPSVAAFWERLRAREEEIERERKAVK